MKDPPQAFGPGRALGGPSGTASGSSVAPSANEVRARRLAALSGGRSGGGHSRGGSSLSPSRRASFIGKDSADVASRPPPAPLRSDVDMDSEGEDGEDLELERALAFSLLPDGEDVEAEKFALVKDRPPTPSCIQDRKLPALPAALAAPAPTAASLEGMLHEPMEVRARECPGGVPDALLTALRSIMWSDGVTTEGDQERWRGQGIDATPSLWREEASMTAEAANGDVSAGGAVSSALGTDPSIWGLTQVHGGPCGVLAALQAETLRMLLFGERVEAAPAPTSAASASAVRVVQLECPRSLPPKGGVGPELTAARIPSRVDVRRALALAVGTVLARAAIARPASVEARAAEEEAKRGDGSR